MFIKKIKTVHLGTVARSALVLENLYKKLAWEPNFDQSFPCKSQPTQHRIIKPDVAKNVSVVRLSSPNKKIEVKRSRDS